MPPENEVELKWYRPCALCHARAKCRKEKVERGSRKCLRLLRKGERERS